MKKCYKWIISICFLICLMGIGQISVHAAGKQVIELKPRKTYRYDLNGDKKKEKIKVIVNSGYGWSRFRIYINNKLQINKKVSEESFFGEPFICILDLKSNDRYKEIYVDFNDFGGAYFAHLYRYKGKKLTQIAYRKDTNAQLCEFSHLNPVQPGNGTIAYRARVSLVTSCQQTVLYNLKIKGGKMQQTSYTHTTDAKYRYKQKLMKTKKATATMGGKRIAFTAKKGSTIQILKIYAKYTKKKSKIYFYVKNSKGKKGWMAAGIGRDFDTIEEY